MFKMTLGAFALALSLAQANAAPSESRLTFVGQALTEKINTVGPQGGLIEFAPAHETRENWTRLVGYRAFPDSRQTAYEAASAHARQMRERYPSERYPESVIRAYEGRGEALAEFSIVMPNGTIEYSVFRYAAGPGGRGLVSLRYSRRMRGSEIGAMPKEAALWAKEVARFDMNRVRTALAQSRG
jgi:hypothetical protein